MHDGRPAESPLTAAEVELLARLWQDSQGEAMGFSEMQFSEMMLQVAASNHSAVDPASSEQRTTFFASIRARDLVIARACALGNEKAWEIFLTEYRELLYRAAYAITRSDAVGRELADSLYAELYGLTTHQGERRSKFTFYTGRGSLAGWLRSVLARRYVDDYRKQRQFIDIEDREAELLTAVPGTAPDAGTAFANELAQSLSAVLSGIEAEDRFLLSAYYLDGRNLADIAKLLNVHESTISRRLKRLSKILRQRLLKQLQVAGLSRRAAEEALSTDVRDIGVNVRRLLQDVEAKPFQALEVASGEKL